MKRVLVGMSGGLDSAFAAYLLKKQGMHVRGLFLHLAGEKDPVKEQKVHDICRILDIPLSIENCSKTFSGVVIKPFIDSYLEGMTPNPCVICNAEFKFQMLFEHADKTDFDLVSTGHYAKIAVSPGVPFYICRGDDLKKDQSYMLYRLKTEWYPRLVFPLGSITKAEITDMAESIFGKFFSSESESQDICFIGGGKHSDFIRDKAACSSCQKGIISDTNGNTLGEHEGVFLYTIGQRKGLGLSGGPWFVISIDPLERRVTVGREKDLFPSVINCTSTVLHGNVSVGDVFYAQHRYRAKASKIIITSLEEDKFTVRAVEPIKAPAPGQSLVLYKDDKVIGGGIIWSTEE